MGNIDPAAVKLPPWTAARRPRPHLRPIVKKNAMAIGSLLMAWNEAHGSLFDVFQWMVVDGDTVVARNLWLALQSDDLRRKAVRAGAAAIDHKKTLHTALIWSLDELDSANEQRKFAAHVYLRDWGDTITPDYFTTDTKKINRHESDPWMDDADALVGDLYAIADYIRGIGMAMRPSGRPRPYVRKPRLQSRRLGQAAKGATKAKVAKKGRRSAPGNSSS